MRVSRFGRSRICHKISRISICTAGTPAEKERAELEGMLLGRIRAADQRLEQRRERPFSREELAVLFAAMLMEE